MMAESQVAATETQASAEPAQLPENHPLVTALATLKRENAAYKVQVARVTELEEANATLETQLAEARLEGVRGRIAVAHGLTQDDAALLMGSEQEMETLARRLAGNPVAPCAEPVAGTQAGYAPELGRVVSIPVAGGDESETSRAFSDFLDNITK